MSGGLGVLSMAWVEAEAAVPLGWRLMALVRQPDSDEWQATAAPRCALAPDAGGLH